MMSGFEARFPDDIQNLLGELIAALKRARSHGVMCVLLGPSDTIKLGSPTSPPISQASPWAGQPCRIRPRSQQLAPVFRKRCRIFGQQNPRIVLDIGAPDVLYFYLIEEQS
jgi:hypothetical protein